MLTDITPREALTMFSKALVAVLEDNDRLARELATAKLTTGNKKKLTASDVRRIHAMKRNGCTQRDIADCLDVNPATISRIVRGHYHGKVA